MNDPIENKLVVGISTRALFDLDAENNVFESEGLDAYREYQRAHEDVVLTAGTAFGLVKGLLGVNAMAPDGPLVEVILLSRNDADSSMRVFNSIDAHGLAITRGAFCGGRDPWPYLAAFHCDLFLSAEPAAVRAALDEGTPAALVLQPPGTTEETIGEVRIAFDGDAVLFDEASDLIYKNEGPEAFFRYEKEHADTPLSPGPFRPFLEGLARVQAKFPAEGSPIRTALVTARNAPAHKRVVNTFRAWGITVNEAYFLGGIDKTRILSRFRPHIFFDDNLAQLERAATAIPSAHVPPRDDRTSKSEPAQPDDQLNLFIAEPKKRGHRRKLDVGFRVPVDGSTRTKASSSRHQQGPGEPRPIQSTDGSKPSPGTALTSRD